MTLFSIAIASGVTPSLLRAFMSAPALTRVFRISTGTVVIVAVCSTVSPYISFTEMSAPLFRRSEYSWARCSSGIIRRIGVFPRLSRAFGSALA